jgi:2-iminoacetate synthase ThiH
VSAWTREHLERAGLAGLVDDRERGVVHADETTIATLARADVLLLGAAADLARRTEHDLAVRIFVPRPPAGLRTYGRERAAGGTALLRAIAVARLTGPIGEPLVVDFDALGLEIAQIALSFGATDLAGTIATRRGLPLADGRQLVKRREIAGLVERAGFRPTFVATERAATHTPTEAR